MDRQIKIITLDIETSARIGLFFGNTYKASIAKVIQEMYVFGFSYKPLGKKVKSVYIWDFPLYKKEPRNDIEVIKKWVEIVSDSDIVIGQNSRSFDDKLMMGRVIVHQLEPPTPFATVDTQKDTSRIARYDSNKLDDVSKNYGFGGKAETGGINLWWDCMLGDKKAQKKMVSYCEKDVVLTERRYLRERPYYKNHPAMNVLTDERDGCPKCGGKRMNKGMKYRATNSNMYQYYRCQDCGGMSKSRVPEIKVKPTYVN